MKKYIKANKYNEEVAQFASKLEFLADNLARVIRANSEHDLELVKQDLGRMYADLNKDECIDAILKNIEYMTEQYRKSSKSVESYPRVEAQLLDFLVSEGYELVELPKSDVGDKAYRITDEYDSDYTIDDMNGLCRDIQSQFGIKWDTALGGSWTSHASTLDGVDFRVGFQRDYDYDPSGDAESLQIVF